MFPTELLTIRRIKGKVIPVFLLQESSDMAEQVIDLFRSSVNEKRSVIEKKIRNMETQYANHKAVRGLSELMIRKGYFESPSRQDAHAVRQYLFKAGRQTPLTEERRLEIMKEAADHFASTVEDVDSAIYGDKESEEILRGFEKVSPDTLCLEYNREIVETILMKSVSMTVTMDDGWRTFLSHVKRNGLMFRVEARDQSVQSIVIDGPLSMHEATGRYGGRFAGLFRHIYPSSSWSIESTVRLKKGTSRESLAFAIDSASSDLFPPVTRYSDPMPSFPWLESWNPDPVAIDQHLYFPDLSVRIGENVHLVDLSNPAYAQSNVKRDQDMISRGIPWITVYVLQEGDKPVKGSVNISAPVNWDALYFALQREVPGGMKKRNAELKQSALNREISPEILEEIRAGVEKRFPDSDGIVEYLESLGYVPSRILPALGYRIKWDGLDMVISRKG